MEKFLMFISGACCGLVAAAFAIGEALDNAEKKGYDKGRIVGRLETDNICMREMIWGYRKGFPNLRDWHCNDEYETKENEEA